MTRGSGISRRKFVADVGCLASAMPLAACVPHSSSQNPTPDQSRPTGADWDLSWAQRVGAATDRAVFDWPSLGTPDDSIVLQIAGRYLDNCAVAYPAGTYTAIAVMNIRTTAIPAAMSDSVWARYSLGAEYKLIDSATQGDAIRNPFWRRAPQAPAAPGMPTLEELVRRGSIILVCDFAMGFLAARLAAKANQTADDVHQTLRRSLVPGAYAVPSGIFGLARSQNAGCAFIRM
jgi:hypothetical protein